MTKPGHRQRVKQLPNHRAHDAPHLIQRWGRLADAAGCHKRVLCEVEGLPVMVIESAAAQRGVPAAYLSSGVHGDEAGSAWGLLAWAEKHVKELRRGSFLIAPCLNPVGLVLNTRADHRGLDLNRRFHIGDDVICGPWQRWITGRAMRFGLCLHEDYDAQGTYLYELNHARNTMGHRIIEKCAKVIAPDSRRSRRHEAWFRQAPATSAMASSCRRNSPSPASQAPDAPLTA